MSSQETTLKPTTAPPEASPQAERLTREEICARYPDEWVVLIDADWICEEGEEIEDAVEFRTAVVLGHSKDRREASRPVRDLPDGFEISDLYTGKRKLPRSLPLW